MAEVTSYKTVATISEGLYKEKMSKFISFAVPVTSAAEAKEVVAKYNVNHLLFWNKIQINTHIGGVWTIL